MNIKLDDIELVKRVDVNGITNEVRSILNVNLSSKRRISEFKIPGLQASVFQDLGRDSLTILVEGVLTGVNSKDTFKEINSKFKLGKPLPFITNIPSLTEVSEVVIESFSARIVSGISSNYWYLLTLREHKSSPPKQAEAPSQEDDAKKSTQDTTRQIREEVEEREAGRRRSEETTSEKEEENEAKTEEKENSKEESSTEEKEEPKPRGANTG